MVLALFRNKGTGKGLHIYGKQRMSKFATMLRTGFPSVFFISTWSLANPRSGLLFEILVLRIVTFPVKKSLPNKGLTHRNSSTPEDAIQAAAPK